MLVTCAANRNRGISVTFSQVCFCSTYYHYHLTVNIVSLLDIHKLRVNAAGWSNCDWLCRWTSQSVRLENRTVHQVTLHQNTINTVVRLCVYSSLHGHSGSVEHVVLSGRTLVSAGSDW